MLQKKARKRSKEGLLCGECAVATELWFSIKKPVELICKNCLLRREIRAYAAKIEGVDYMEGVDYFERPVE